MKRLLTCVCLAGVLVPVGGCEIVLDILQPKIVTVRLVNNGSFDVDVELYISGTQEILESLLTSTGTKIEYTLEAGETVTFSRDCDDLQAIIIDNADLKVLGGIGPSADTDVLRDGTDFSCGDTITFTFDHSLVVVDFDITVNAN